MVYGALTCLDCGYVEKTEDAPKAHDRAFAGDPSAYDASYTSQADNTGGGYSYGGGNPAGSTGSYYVSAPVVQKTKGNSYGWVIALVVSLVLIVLAAGGVFLYMVNEAFRSVDVGGLAWNESAESVKRPENDKNSNSYNDSKKDKNNESVRPESEFLIFLLEGVYGKDISLVTQAEINDILYLDIYEMEHTGALSFDVMLSDGTQASYLTDYDDVDTRDFKCLKGLQYLRLAVGGIDYGTDWHGLDELQSLECKASPAEIAKVMDPSQLLSLNVKSTFGMEGLQGMQAFTNLAFLTVKGISSIEGVSEIPSLIGFYLEDAGRVKDFSELYQMPWLEELAIESKGLRDIGFVSGMDNLVYLELSGTDLKNIDAIADCADTLVALYLDRNYRIEDYSVVLECTELEELELYVDYDFDVPMEVPDLSVMPNLRILHLGNFDRFSNLGLLTGLESLTLEGPSFNSAEALASLTNLRSLNFWNVSVLEGSFDMLYCLTNLEYLDLKESFVWCDISPVFALPNLKWLNLERTKCGLDIKKTPVSKRLTYLNLTKTVFYGLKEDGKWDYVNDTRIPLGDVPELFACAPNLRVLYVPGHELESLDFAEPLTELYILDISDNYITDAGPILGIRDKLLILMCEGTPLTDLSAFEDAIIFR